MAGYPFLINGHYRTLDMGFTAVWPDDGRFKTTYRPYEIPTDRVGLCMTNLRKQGRVNVYHMTTMDVVAIAEYRGGRFVLRTPEYYGPTVEFAHSADLLAHLANNYC